MKKHASRSATRTQSFPRQLQMVWPERREPPAVAVPAGYRVRQFRDGDTEDYLALMRAAGFAVFNSEFLSGCRRKTIPGGFFVVEKISTGALVSSAMATHNPTDLHAGGGELGWVATHPKYLGKGLASSVCAVAIGRFLEAGYSRIYLRTDDWRAPAVSIYLRLGFVPFLYAWDMEGRWKTVCRALNAPFSARKCARPPANLVLSRRKEMAAAKALYIWRAESERERSARIFREELDGFLPDKMLDFHVHLLNRDAIPANGSYDCAGHPIPKYDLSDLKRDTAALYPGRRVSAVCFGLPQLDFDMRSNNEYVAEACDGKRFFPFRLFDPTETDRAAVRSEIVKGRFFGLKPYPDYVRGRRAGDEQVRDMLPPWIMEIADDLRLIVMLHLPRPQRLADPINRRQTIEWCRRYPRAKIVLAHIGRAYYLKNIVGQLDELRSVPNLWYDLAMLNNWEVLEYLFKTVDPTRILYGSDMPIACAPGKSVEINDQYTYVTPAPWRLSVSDNRGKIRFASFLYEELRAIEKAVRRLGLDEEFVEGLFYGNGWSLLHGHHTERHG